MGTTITDWADVEGAMYIGAGGSEMIWFGISVLLCLWALVSGSMHELNSYKKLKK